MATRSFFITVQNYTGRTWQRIGLGLDHGIWSNNGGFVPPEEIPKLSLDADGNALPGVGAFENESDGVATGCQGFVEYRNEQGGVLHIDWDNPYIGSNHFNANVPDGYRAYYGDIHGNDANVTVDIRRG